MLTTSFYRDLGWSLRIYTSDIFPVYLDNAGVGTTCQEPLLGHMCIFLAFLVMKWFFLVGSIVSLNCLQMFYPKAQDLTLLSHFLFFQKYFLR